VLVGDHSAQTIPRDVADSAVYWAQGPLFSFVCCHNSIHFKIFKLSNFPSVLHSSLVPAIFSSPSLPLWRHTSFYATAPAREQTFSMLVRCHDRGSSSVLGTQSPHYNFQDPDTLTLFFFLIIPHLILRFSINCSIPRGTHLIHTHIIDPRLLPPVSPDKVPVLSHPVSLRYHVGCQFWFPGRWLDQ